MHYSAAISDMYVFNFIPHKNLPPEIVDFDDSDNRLMYLIYLLWKSNFRHSWQDWIWEMSNREYLILAWECPKN